MKRVMNNLAGNSNKLTPKGPKSQNGFFGSSGRLSRLSKYEWVCEILEEGRTM